MLTSPELELVASDHFVGLGANALVLKGNQPGVGPVKLCSYILLRMLFHSGLRSRQASSQIQISLQVLHKLLVSGINIITKRRNCVAICHHELQRRELLRLSAFSALCSEISNLLGMISFLVISQVSLAGAP